MKFLKQIQVAVILTIILFGKNSSAQVAAQDPTALVQNFDIKINNLGDASWELSQQMNQAQWEYFKQGPLVNDPSISKRDMERALSTFVIEDFKRDVDEMNRSVKMDFNVKAQANYHGDGKWIYNLNMKNPDITKLSDNSYMSEANTIMGGQIVRQRYKISFPGSAKNIQQSTDSFGNAIFTYSLGGGAGAYLKWNNILGALLIIAAVILFLNLSSPKKPDIIGPDHQIEHTGLKV